MFFLLTQIYDHVILKTLQQVKEKLFMKNQTEFKGITEEQAYDLGLLFEKHNRSFEKAYADPIVDKVRQDVLSKFDVEIDGILMGFVNPLTYDVMSELYMVRSPRYLFVYKTLNNIGQALFLKSEFDVIMLAKAETNEVTPDDTEDFTVQFTLAEIERAGYNPDNYEAVSIDGHKSKDELTPDDSSEPVVPVNDEPTALPDRTETENDEAQISKKAVQGYKPTKPSI